MVSSTAFAVLLAAVTASVSASGRFENDWDEQLEFTCPSMSGQGIYMIETDGHFGDPSNHWSTNHGYKEDRKWGFDCKEMGTSKDQHGCKWLYGLDDGWITDREWINNYREDFVNVTCPNDGIVAGFKSIHSNKWEDRIWNVYCCTGSHAKADDCEWRSPQELTDGDDDWKFEFQGAKEFIRSVKSDWIGIRYGEGREDRTWQFEVCKTIKCWTVPGNNEKRSSVVATKGNRVVNSVSTSLNCNSRHTIEFEEGTETIQTNSVEVTSSKGQENSETHGGSFSIGVMAQSPAGSISLSAGGSLDVTKSKSTEETNSKSYSSASTTYAVQFDWFTGPSAMMIMSESDTYTFNDNSYTLTELRQCEGTDEVELVTKQVAISVKTYGQTHFTTRYAKFRSEKDCINNQVAVEKCLNSLRFMKGENEAIGQGFEACFAKKNSDGEIRYSEETNEKGQLIPEWLDGIVDHGVTL